MAIGISRMFGLALPTNFMSPYKASSLIEFWRRWHISLSRFLADYVFSPLAFATRRRRLMTHASIVVTMTLCGLWHGAGYTFLIWGFAHGVALAASHAFRLLEGRSPALERWSVGRRPLFAALTFAFVTVAWIPFRAGSLKDCVTILHGLTGGNGFALPAQLAALAPHVGQWVKVVGTLPLLADGSIMGLAELVVMIVVAAGVAFLMPNTFELTHGRRMTVTAALLPLLAQKIAFSSKVEFLYFQF
jgi:hypothetical protein